jgi:hypothetical protein
MGLKGYMLWVMGQLALLPTCREPPHRGDRHGPVGAAHEDAHLGEGQPGREEDAADGAHGHGVDVDQSVGSLHSLPVLGFGV